VAGGNKSKAAELLQIKRSTLGDRIKKLGLPDGGGDDAGRSAGAD
jgi:DNA-binding NtrC family response regulator